MCFVNLSSMAHSSAACLAQGYFRKCGGKSLDNLALSCLFSLPSSSLRYIDIKTKLLFVDPGKGRDGPVSD